jgi:inhibitor of cysteine peptidase
MVLYKGYIGELPSRSGSEPPSQLLEEFGRRNDMKGIMLAQLAAILTCAAWTAQAQSPAPVNQADQPRQEAKPVVSEADSQKGEIAVGEVFSIKLPCNPTTGFKWEVKSINRKVAAPTGPAEFQESPAASGAVGAGGTCVLRIKGVKPGTTKAILVYRRSWEKGEPAKTSTAEIKVLPKKKS